MTNYEEFNNTDDDTSSSKTQLDLIREGTESYICALVNEIRKIHYPEYFDIKKWLDTDVLKDKSHILDCYLGDKAMYCNENGLLEKCVIIDHFIRYGEPYKRILKWEQNEIKGLDVPAEKVYFCI